MKPHEETWRAEGRAWVERRIDTATISEVKVNGTVEEQAQYTRLIAAAPEMARALLEIGEAIAAGTLDEEGAGEVIRRALAKAGVVP